MRHTQETKSRELAKFLSNYDCIFVDTCSLMEESFPEFASDLRTLYEDDYWTEKIIVLEECINELKKHEKSKEAGKRIDAKGALKVLRRDRWRPGHAKIFEIEKTKRKNLGFADNVLYNLVNELRSRKRVLVITQDKKLAYDLRGLNHLGSQKGRRVDVYKLRRDSGLEENYGENENGFAPHSKNKNVVSAPLKNEKPSPKPVVSVAPKKETQIPKDDIYLAEKRLSADLRDPKIAKDKKIKAINEQVARLSALSEKDRSSLTLAFTLEQLKKEKEKLLNEPSSLPSRREANKKEEAAKPVTSVKETKPLEEPLPSEKKTWTERGRNASFAFERLGEHYGWLFRDSSVPFVKGVHGAFDLTAGDLSKMDLLTKDMKIKEEKDVSFHGLIIHVVREEGGYLLSMAKKEERPIAKGQSPIKNESKVTPAKKEEKTPSTPKKDSDKKSKEPLIKNPKTAKPTANTPSKTHAKPSIAKKDNKPLTMMDGMAAVPPGVTLSVGEPRQKSVPTAQKKPQTLEEKKTLKKPSVSDLHRAELPQGEKDASKKSRLPSPNFAEASKNDKKLNANLNNPNYPKEAKIKDIKSQITLIRTLKPSETKKLLLGLRVLEGRLKELSK